MSKKNSKRAQIEWVNRKPELMLYRILYATRGCVAGWQPYSYPCSRIYTCLNIPIVNIISFRESMFCMNFDPEIYFFSKIKAKNTKKEKCQNCIFTTCPH